MRSCKLSALLFLTLLVPFAAGPDRAHAQVATEAGEESFSVSPRNRVVEPVEDARRVTLAGDTLPQALPAHETGAVESDRRLEHVLLLLKPDPAQQAALNALVEAQQNPRSALYHHWLTPKRYAQYFGVSNDDIEQVEQWLQRYGLQIDEVAVSHRTLTFSGKAAQVEAAFQTQMRTYSFAGKQHIANATDPTVPAALAEVVGGVVSLHDFFSTPQHSSIRLRPEYTAGSSHYLSPADFATIYNVNSLYHQAYDGSGETIAIVGRANITLNDVRAFRSQFGLAAKDPVVIVNGRDPGSSSSGDVDEATLDVEWSGAVANGATIDFVTSASTATTDGIYLSAQYVVNHNLAPIVNVSFGLCEQSLGASGNSFLNSLWEQAAAQGISVLVSAGDSGAAGCDAASATKAKLGRGVNGICATPYSTCVGGTQFQEGSNPGLYWRSTNGGSGESAASYIPEVAWNESGSGGLWSTGGGVSTIYAKPSWQTGFGVPADGRRDVPDVALTAAGHDGYLVQVGGSLYAFSGTSAAAPSFAGLLALVAHKASARLGNANAELYKLASTPQGIAGVGAVFHDVTSGNNSVPGVTGYSAGHGYDAVTGLGSVDAEKLVASWGGSAPQPTLTLTTSPVGSTLVRGATLTVNLKTTVGGGFDSPVSFSINGLPSGVTARFMPSSLAAPGAGSSSLTLSATKTAPLGAVRAKITASGAALAESSAIAFTVAAANTNGRRYPIVPIGRERQD